MSSTPRQELLELACAGLFGSSAAVPPAGAVRDDIQRNGLAPHLFLTLKGQGALQGEWQGIQGAYLKATQVHAQRLRTGIELAEALETRGIPTICYRGPFSGLSLYGDLGSRPFQDIDLIVPANQADSALALATELGYRSQQEGIDPGYFRRHHIHWALHRDGTLLDLHWRVMHPYALYRIDYTRLFADSQLVERQGFTWREPSPMHLFLLCCLQLLKTEKQALRLARDPKAVEHLFEQRLFWKWADLAVLWNRHQDTFAADGYRELLDTAATWRAGPSLAAALAGLESLFGLRVPAACRNELEAAGDWPTQSPAYEAESGGPAWLHALALKRGGFRFSRVRDVGAYLLPPSDYFRRGDSQAPVPVQAVAHLARATGRMTFAALDSAWTLGLRPLFSRAAASPDTPASPQPPTPSSPPASAGEAA